jgi:lipoprotein-anchoring transpeptidase ErfK/SrfK
MECVLNTEGEFIGAVRASTVDIRIYIFEPPESTSIVPRHEPTHLPPDTFLASMARYEVKCVTIDYGSQFDDCRCIEEIGFPAKDGVTATRTPAQVYELVEEEGHTVIVGYRGSEVEVVGATHGSTKYVRTEPTDTDEDRLLKQPSC